VDQPVWLWLESGALGRDRLEARVVKVSADASGKFIVRMQFTSAISLQIGRRWGAKLRGDEQGQSKTGAWNSAGAGWNFDRLKLLDLPIAAAKVSTGQHLAVCSAVQIDRPLECR
jgi:hypothetical protein